MTEIEVDHWFESREGQYFCKQCNRLLAGVAPKEAFAREDSTEETNYRRDSCGQSIALPSPR
jgi:hypothetical protein